MSLVSNSAEYVCGCSRSDHHGTGNFRTGIVHQRRRDVHHAGRHRHWNGGGIGRFQHSRRSGLLRTVFRNCESCFQVNAIQMELYFSSVRSLRSEISLEIIDKFDCPSTRKHWRFLKKLK